MTEKATCLRFHKKSGSFVLITAYVLLNSELVFIEETGVKTIGMSFSNAKVFRFSCFGMLR